MTILYLFLLMLVSLACGVYIGARLRIKEKCNGIIIAKETERGITYELQFYGDPEIIALMDEVKFKVIPPNWSSQDKLGL